MVRCGLRSSPGVKPVIREDEMERRDLLKSVSLGGVAAVGGVAVGGGGVTVSGSQKLPEGKLLSPL